MDFCGWKYTISALSDLFNSKMNEFQRDLQREWQVEFLDREVERLEMKRRRKTLLFHGVAEEKSEDISARITSLVASSYPA
ncbi:unnamed protein product [Euphydryas editha]|uniref:Uncharacterized protein n=1 Tax=Euphydryas editha TaxID=104508 RepID=A0AAU9U5M1_EUPED|nr:unnamed protein product [Euphydryas editha]